ncbi:MAG: Na/Pi symporter [Candidatus Omnitrophica bacterium]|nr:Na/Pi symporter [Candidatus Omnitrophota bacterium]
MHKKSLQAYLQISIVIVFVYLFLVSIGLMSVAFKGFGKEFAENLIKTTSNPFVGLFIGILATSIVQSSSTTTSIVVGMVGSGCITVTCAIPIIMGANIGTTVTNTLVSIGHIGRREEFKRAVSGATIHDFFNIICVIIFLPLQLTTGFLYKAATFMSRAFANVGGIKFTSPIKFATEPLVDIIKNLTLKLSPNSHFAYICMLFISILILFAALYFIVQVMKSLIAKRAEIVLNNIVGKYGILTILVATLFTAIIQSSSITTSLMVPLVAAGILTVQTTFPIIMGANIGTTITAILASFATGNIAAITVAFVHFLFNFLGVCLIYPIKPLRKIPIFLAQSLGNIAYKKRHFVIFYVLGQFFLLPSLIILISKLFK